MAQDHQDLQIQRDWGDRALVNLTSGEPDHARRMAAWAAERGIAYLDGAILTPTPTIGAPRQRSSTAAPSGSYASIRETLTAIGGSAVRVGEDPGRASAYEVALLDIFATSVHGIVHAFALASAENISAQSLAPFAIGSGPSSPR